MHHGHDASAFNHCPNVLIATYPYPPLSLSLKLRGEKMRTEMDKKVVRSSKIPYHEHATFGTFFEQLCSLDLAHDELQISMPSCWVG